MKFLSVFFVCLMIFQVSYGLTKAQLKNTAKTMKNVCLTKSNVSEDLVKNIHKGEFVEDRDVKCYIACVLKMAGTMKNGKLNYDAAVKQINILFPEDMREPVIKSMSDCKSVADKYKDICEGSFQTAKCMFNSNPDVFFFP